MLKESSNTNLDVAFQAFKHNLDYDTSLTAFVC